MTPAGPHRRPVQVRLAGRNSQRLGLEMSGSVMVFRWQATKSRYFRMSGAN